MKLYVASSWRNTKQPEVVQMLRAVGHSVYDFRRPHVLNTGFSWAAIDPEWQKWSPAEFREALEDPLAIEGFGYDMAALALCEACVLVLPCGRSAHLEAGYAIGQGKRTLVLLESGDPELMYRMCSELCVDIGQLVRALERLR